MVGSACQSSKRMPHLCEGEGEGDGVAEGDGTGEGLGEAVFAAAPETNLVL